MSKFTSMFENVMRIEVKILKIHVETDTNL